MIKRIWNESYARTWPGRAVDVLVDGFVFLPLYVTDKSPRVAIRLLGIAWYMAWVFPAALIAMIPMMLLIFADIIADTIRGPNA